MSEPERASAPFITFYSFKGGVGRSMALINVAGIIAARGFRVLVIDMDLEAPGLSFLANPGEREIPEARRQPGFVDFMLDALEAKADADLFKLSPTEVVERYSVPYELPEGFSRNPAGSLRIMPAGWLDANYSRRLERLDLPGLYRDGTGLPLLEAFKQIIRDSYCFDYVFIDSRTGFSDESGICTRDLADCLIVVSGLNRQNVEGTTRLLTTLRQSTDRPKLLEIVLSPIPNGEDALVDERVIKAREAFSAAWAAELRTDLSIPYHPQLALTEEPHIFRRRTGYLFDAYHKIERRLRELLGHTPEVWLDQAWTAYRAQDYESVLMLLQRTDMVADMMEWADQFALTVGLEDSGAEGVYNFVIARANSHVRAATAERIYKSAILAEKEEKPELANALYLRSLDASPNDRRALLRYAWFLTSRRDLDAAESMFKRGVAMAEPGPDILSAYATFLWVKRKESSVSESMFIEALTAAPNHTLSLANYGGFCICAGRLDEGLALVDRALQTVDRRRSRQSPIFAECWMYIYCCGAPGRRDEALSELKTLVELSIFTDDWDFSCVIHQARTREHPHQKWLPVLADVLGRRQPSTALADWAAWREAVSDSISGKISKFIDGFLRGPEPHSD
ncbi:MAG TPA: hypothetical protein VK034_12080 [Enhygromyxa sp.]|nr:hypothetical protein [Enhygromyxa sp.]